VSQRTSLRSRTLALRCLQGMNGTRPESFRGAVSQRQRRETASLPGEIAGATPGKAIYQCTWPINQHLCWRASCSQGCSRICSASTLSNCALPSSSACSSPELLAPSFISSPTGSGYADPRVSSSVRSMTAESQRVRAVSISRFVLRSGVAFRSPDAYRGSFPDVT
jgi:hypothetical protein